MIYKRQRILLKVLSKKKSAISKIRLMKWLFLIRHETNISNECSFYDFIPYHYGPFSFTVYRDLAEMARLALAGQDKKSVWCKKKNCREEFTRLPLRSLRAIDAVITTYGDFEQKELSKYIYNQYPWYASKSRFRTKPKQKSSSIKKAIYTVGYEDLTIDGFLDYVLSRNMEAIIDVRHNPISRKYGFSKKSFARLCNKLDIEYYHYPQLGIPSSYRVNIHTFSECDYRKLWKLYERSIIESQSTFLGDVMKIVKSKPAAILCFEKEPKKCHRSRLSDVLSRSLNLEVVHL